MLIGENKGDRRWPQYCPKCSGEHGNPKFVRGYQVGISEMNAGSGEVEGCTCTNVFHNKRKK
jgi:hypothetical protein